METKIYFSIFSIIFLLSATNILGLEKIPFSDNSSSRPPSMGIGKGNVSNSDASNNDMFNKTVNNSPVAENIQGSIKVGHLEDKNIVTIIFASLFAVFVLVIATAFILAHIYLKKK